MKISLKFIKEQKIESDFPKDISLNSTTNVIDRKNLLYEIPNENLEHDTILNVKHFIAININSSLEKIYLTTSLDNQKINPENENNLFDYGLEDNLILSKLFDEEKKLENSFLNTFNFMKKEDGPILYYKEHSKIEKTSIEVIFNLENISKIKLEVFSICSIYIIKDILMKNDELKIKNASEIILYNYENPLNDNDIIFKIIEENKIIESDKINQKNINQNEASEKPLVLKMIKKGKKKFAIGIDLTFNSMKNISKVKYSNEAPNYREAKDGLNLLCYCRNDLCELCNEMFLVNLGR
jgi:hypothetical protein